MSLARFTTCSLLLLLFFGLLISASNSHARTDTFNRCAGLATDPDDPLGPKGIDGIWLERINVKGALPACRKALKVEPEDKTLRYLLARTLFSQAQQAREPIPNEVKEIVAELMEAEYWSAGMMMLAYTDQKQSNIILSKAAEQGHPLANYIQGFMLYTQNKHEEALLFLKKSANAGMAQAHNAIFVVLKDFFGQRFDEKSALDFLRRGMILGDANAGKELNRLGTQDDMSKYRSINTNILINNGSDKGVAISARINTLRRDIKLGDDRSMAQLGEHLLTRGGTVDRREAEYWLKNAQAKDPSALFQLFKLYITAQPVRIEDAEHIIGLMRNAVHPIIDGPYFDEDTIKELTNRIQYERIDDTVQGSLDDIRNLASLENNKWYDSAIEKMLYKVKAKSLQTNTYRVSLTLSTPSNPKSSINFELERIDGAEEQGCTYMYHDFSSFSLDYASNITEYGKARHNDVSGKINANCAALFPARIKIMCETAVICGRGDKEDYGRCGRHSSTEYVTLPAFRHSISFSTSTDLETSSRYGMIMRNKCEIRAIDEQKYHHEFEHPSYPD